MTIRTEKQGSLAEPVLLDATVLRPFEIGARLDALLCYPTWSRVRQQRLADAICAKLIAHSIAADPSRKADLWRKFPEYRIGRARASLETLPERRDDALIAGLGFLPLLKNAAIGKLPILRGREGELSVAEVARFLWPAREHGSEINYESRLSDRRKHGLRSFYLIAHLAAAYQYIARERAGDADWASFDYQDLDFHRDVVRRANEYAGYFAAMPRWGNISGALIPIQWQEEPAQLSSPSEIRNHD